ncbi:hypothetical protein D1007_56117 [Hordeum vulgare]|nr:hypothetical protein D1007_56117 [Hordeum vulgare]
MANSRWRRRTRQLRPQVQVSAPVVIREVERMPMEMRPQVDSRSPEAREEILRVVRERFPIRDAWPEICVEVIRNSTIAERCRFTGDDGGMDYDLIFWAIQEAESSDPLQAARWSRFKSTSPSRLNIRPPSIVELASIPLEHLPPSVSPPRLP